MNSQVSDVNGFKGNFSSTITNNNGDITEVSHGVIILATGAVEYRGPDYNYGTDERILAMGEFEKRLAERPAEELPESIVMILCVFS